MKNKSLSILPEGFLLLASAILIFNFSLNSCSDKVDDLPKDSIPTNGDGSFTDSRDGNIYQYKTFGTQIWMTRNLAYLPAVSPGTSGSTTAKLYYVYEYEGSDVAAAKANQNYKTYGVLYNWPAAMNLAAGSDAVPSGVTGACPAGWHLPSDKEWKILEGYLGMSTEGTDAVSLRLPGSVGRKLKTTTGWLDNGNGDGTSGFSALPGGYRTNDGSEFVRLGGSAYFWSSSIYLRTNWENGAWDRYLQGSNDGVVRDMPYHSDGLSVRCI